MTRIVSIVVDTREPERIASLLTSLGVNVERRMITPGDYVLSEACALERKTVNDFMISLFSGRLFEQIESLKTAYTKPILLLEGDVKTELAGMRSQRAFWGGLIKVLDMGVPILYAPTAAHSADLLTVLACRLQRDWEESSSIMVQHKPRLMTDLDWQLYILSSLPGVGNELAMRLLKRFGSVRRVFEASETALEEVEGLGRIKASRLSRVLDLRLQGTPKNSMNWR